MKFIANLRKKAEKSVIGRAAITLVELTLVLALAAIVVFVAVRAYSNAQENSRVQQTASTIGQVRSVVESLAQGQANYANVASYSSIKASLPASLDNGTALTQPFGTLLVAPVAANSAQYTITASALPADACQRLAVMDMGRSVVSVEVSGGSAIVETPATPAHAATDCANGGDVTWTFQ